ncbi:MAG: hypothetical protein Q9164_000072 [Protoblastenia rupestris]
MSSPSSSDPPLTLIVRFSASIPDLPLSISSPRTTFTSTLSTLTRPQLPADLSTCPLRYIYAGALLPPKASLSTILRLEQTPQTNQKFYIHCSISTSTHLSPVELEDEATTSASLQHSIATTSAAAGITQNATSQPHPQPAPPQGFDRLLTAGFTTTEVASLRSQFLALHSHTHTPDTMPSPSELRLLEERWLDSNNPTNTTGNTGDDGGDGTLAGGPGGLEDILWGNIMGFFWAVGAIVWLVREEGVWSKRRQVGVLTGVLVNVAFCVLRAGS